MTYGLGYEHEDLPGSQSGSESTWNDTETGYEYHPASDPEKSGPRILERFVTNHGEFAFRYTCPQCGESEPIKELGQISFSTTGRPVWYESMTSDKGVFRCPFCGYSQRGMKFPYDEDKWEG